MVTRPEVASGGAGTTVAAEKGPDPQKFAAETANACCFFSTGNTTENTALTPFVPDGGTTVVTTLVMADHDGETTLVVCQTVNE